MVAYMVDVNLNQSEGLKFANKLSKVDRNILEDRFRSSTTYDHPTLDIIMETFTNEEINEPLEIVNTALRESELSGCILLEEQVTAKIQLLLKERDVMRPINEILLKKDVIFEIISKNATSESRYISHFLLDYSKVTSIYQDNPTDSEYRMLKILDCWDRKEENTEKKWRYLVSLLNFLNKGKLTKDLVHDESRKRKHTHKCSQKKNENSEQEDISDEVDTDVIDIVAEMIGIEWKKIAFGLGLKRNTINIIEAENPSDKDKMFQCFDEIVSKLSWQKLKKSLLKCGALGDQIIERIANETYLTENFKICVRQYKSELIAMLKDQQMQNASMGSDGAEFETIQREQSVVDVVIVDKVMIDKQWQNPYRDDQLKHVLTSKESISIDRILTPDINFTICSGPAGMGKSTLLETITYRWANNNMLNGADDSLNIKLLLPLNSRDLNMKISNGDATTKDILIQLFPRIFKYVTFEFLEDISKHILIIIDGIDELKDVQQLADSLLGENDEMSPTVRFLYDLTNPKLDSVVLFGKNIFLAGRPEACRNIQSIFEKLTPIKKVEICGFNEENVKKYVKNFTIRFSLDKKIEQSILSKIEESNVSNAMAQIPIYLWVICELHRVTGDIPLPTTTTELLLYVCLVYIRNHFKINGESLCEVSLSELCQNKDIISHLIKISEFSCQTLKERIVVFDCDNIDGTIDLEHKSGFVVKVRLGEKGFVYQFRHLVLQELFCALYVFLCSDETEKKLLFENYNIKDCLHLVAGLEGIWEGGENKLKQLLLALLNHGRFSYIDSITCMAWLEEIHLSEILINDYIRNTSKFPSNIYPRSLFEYKLGFPNSMKENIKEFHELSLVFRPPAIGIEWLLHLLKIFCTNFPQHVVHIDICTSLSEDQQLSLSKYVSSFKSFAIEHYISNFQILSNAIDEHIKSSDTLTLESLKIADPEDKLEMCQFANTVPCLKKLYTSCRHMPVISKTINTHVQSGGQCRLKDLTLLWYNSSKCELNALIDCLKHLEKLKINLVSDYLFNNIHLLTNQITKLYDDRELMLDTLHLKEMMPPLRLPRVQPGRVKEIMTGLEHVTNIEVKGFGSDGKFKIVNNVADFISHK